MGMKKFKVTLVCTKVVEAENREDANTEFEIEFSDEYGSDYPLKEIGKMTIKEIKRERK